MCLDLTVLFSYIFKGDWDFLTVTPAGFRCLWPPQNRSWVPWGPSAVRIQLVALTAILEICSVSHTAHSGCAVGLTGLKMTFSLPFNPLISFGNYLGIHLYILFSGITIVVVAPMLKSSYLWRSGASWNWLITSQRSRETPNVCWVLSLQDCLVDMVSVISVTHSVFGWYILFIII